MRICTFVLLYQFIHHVCDDVKFFCKTLTFGYFVLFYFIYSVTQFFVCLFYFWPSGFPPMIGQLFIHTCVCVYLDTLYIRYLYTVHFLYI